MTTSPGGTFLEFARLQGITVDPAKLVADGRIRRADVGESASGKNDASYLLRENGSGWVINFKGDGRTVHYRPERTRNPTTEELAKIEAERQAFRAEQFERRQQAIVESVAIWNRARDGNDFPYLKTPDIPAYGLRQSWGRLLVPVLAIDDGDVSWVGMQRIETAESGQSATKRFMTGTPTKGAFAVIPILGADEEAPLRAFDEAKVASRVILCEGIGTALAIHHATGLPVIAALSAQNLPEVAEKLHDSHLHGEVLVYADNDGETAHYKGQTYAWQAAEILGKNTRVALPMKPFGETPSGYDARDQLRDGGIQAITGTIAVAESLYESKFVRLANGSLDFGMLPSEVGKLIGRQSGAIRLRHSDLKHIEDRHGAQILKAGFVDVVRFVSSITEDYNSIYKAKSGALMIGMLLPGEMPRYAVMQLEPSITDDCYEVRTATLSRREFFKNKEPLLLRDGPIAQPHLHAEIFDPDLEVALIDRTEAKLESQQERGQFVAHTVALTEKESGMDQTTETQGTKPKSGGEKDCEVAGDVANLPPAVAIDRTGDASPVKHGIDHAYLGAEFVLARMDFSERDALLDAGEGKPLKVEQRALLASGENYPPLIDGDGRLNNDGANTYKRLKDAMEEDRQLQQQLRTRNIGEELEAQQEEKAQQAQATDQEARQAQPDPLVEMRRPQRRQQSHGMGM